MRKTQVGFLACIFVLASLLTSGVCIGQEQPPGLPWAPMGVKYAFENGSVWNKPTVGYACGYKEDAAGTVMRPPGPMEYLRVFGEVGDVATVTQLGGDANRNFRLFRGRKQTAIVRRHPDGTYARFRCTRGERYGFREKPLYIRLRTKYGIVKGPVEAGGTFGIRGQRDPYNWGFNTWDQAGETFQVASNDDGSERVRTPPLPPGGYGSVAVRTEPDALDVVNAYLKEPAVSSKVNVRWEMNSRFAIYWRYILATVAPLSLDPLSAVSAKAKFRFASSFPGFPQDVAGERWEFSVERSGTSGLPLVWSNWLVQSTGDGYPASWYFVRPAAPAFWPLYEPYHKAIIDDTEEDALTLKAKGAFEDTGTIWKSQLEMFLDGEEPHDSAVDVRLYVDFPF